MKCTEWPCTENHEPWKKLLKHYRENHPWVKKPWLYFTKEARDNIIGEPCGCNKK